MELEFGGDHVPEGCRSRDEVLGWTRGDNKSQLFPKRFIVEVIQCYRGMEFKNLKCFYEYVVGVKVLKGQDPIFCEEWFGVL